jgi:hypothetical protein
MQIVPRCCFVRIQFGFRRNAAANEAQRFGFRSEHTGERITAALADHDNDLALARLILP